MDNVQIFDVLIKKIEFKMKEIINEEGNKILNDVKEVIFNKVKETIERVTEKLQKSAMDALLDIKAIYYPNTLLRKLSSNKIEVKYEKVCHKKIKDETNPTPWHKCTRCEKTFSRKVYLDTHVKTVHQKIKDLYCHICDFATGDRSGLDKHIVRKHPDYTRYSCNICEFSAYRLVNLKKHYYNVHSMNVSRHQRIFDEMNPLEVNASFLKKNDSMPLKNRIHLCFQCGCAFTDLAELNNHMSDSHQEMVLRDLSRS